MSAEIVSLDKLRARREARRRVQAAQAAQLQPRVIPPVSWGPGPRPTTHPALRWVAGTDRTVAHRRYGATAACGAPGTLAVAAVDVPLCRSCYRPRR